jgi:hypothetical protein
MAIASEPSDSGDSESCGGGGAACPSSVGSAPLVRQFLTFTAHFGRHTETLHATSDTSLKELQRLLVTTGGCVVVWGALAACVRAGAFPCAAPLRAAPLQAAPLRAAAARGPVSSPANAPQLAADTQRCRRQRPAARRTC